MNTDLVSYYKLRAEEYESIYDKPERQDDIAHASQILKNVFAGKHVIEVACGTGFWTRRIGESARSIRATDVNNTVLEIARRKTYRPAAITFAKEDLFHSVDEQRYEAMFGGFIWSHIAVATLPEFLKVCSERVVEGGCLVLMDNKYVEGSSLPIAASDEQGNTYQRRLLADRSEHMILKNFPTEDFVKQCLEDTAYDIEFLSLQYYWIVIYKRR